MVAARQLEHEASATTGDPAEVVLCVTGPDGEEIFQIDEMPYSTGYSSFQNSFNVMVSCCF